MRPRTEGLNDMVVASDGSVFLTGAGVVKLDPRGAIDTSYGSGGRVELRTSSPLLDDAGNLLALSEMEVVRLDRTGRLDASFGNSGRVRLDGWTLFSDFPSALALDRDGNVYVAGSRFGIPGYSTGVVKLDRSGRPVAAFGIGGSFNVPSDRPTRVNTLALDADGNVYVGGYDFIPFVGAGNSRLMVIKADRDGRLAAEFGAGGVWRDESCETFAAGVLSLVVDASGNLVIGGECHPVAPRVWLATVRKLDGRGNPVTFRDPRHELFGVSSPPGPLVEAREARSILVRPDRTIYAGGARLGATSAIDPAVAKLGPEGAHISEFGSGGVVAFSDAPGYVRRIGLDGQGRLYVGIVTPAGTAESPPTPDFVVYRLAG